MAFMPVFRRILIAILVLICLLAIWHAELLLYAIRQGVGQMSLIWLARPVEEVLEQSDVPDSVKQKLYLVAEVRRFAIDSLGLNDTRNYRKLYDQKGKEVLWVVTACRPYEMQEKRWDFPVIGQVPYKGFFNRLHAEKEKASLEKEGWDVSIRNPGGWSTLGWFEDPLLSNMLFRSEGDLANLIIHEMAHATIYVKDSADLNENLASYIGDQGARDFLVYKYGTASAEYNRYVAEEEEYKKLVSHMLRGYVILDSLYASIRSMPDAEKHKLKYQHIENIIHTADTLGLTYIRPPSSIFQNSLPNNTYFMNFKRYQSRQDEIKKQCKAIGDNLADCIRYFKSRYPVR
jgi:predicted aminopeptidase